MCIKKVAEKGLCITLDWTTDSYIFIDAAAAMDKECGSRTVLQALEDFKNESDFLWKKKQRKKEK